MTSVPTAGDLVRTVCAGVGRLIVAGTSPAEREILLDELAGCYAEQTDVRHPFAPFGDRPLTTRAELRDHFDQVGRVVAQSARAESYEAVDLRVHRTDDPEVDIVEFRYTGTVDGRPFELPCIFVVRARDGEIVESRDYSNHLAAARAFGRLADVRDALTGELASAST